MFKCPYRTRQDDVTIWQRLAFLGITDAINPRYAGPFWWGHCLFHFAILQTRRQTVVIARNSECSINNIYILKVTFLEWFAYSYPSIWSHWHLLQEWTIYQWKWEIEAVKVTRVQTCTVLLVFVRTGHAPRVMGGGVVGVDAVETRGSKEGILLFDKWAFFYRCLLFWRTREWSLDTPETSLVKRIVLSEQSSPSVQHILPVHTFICAVYR